MPGAPVKPRTALLTTLALLFLFLVALSASRPAKPAKAKPPAGVTPIPMH